MQERLQKLIAAAGIASRRHAEELISAGKVTVNGKVVAVLGAKASILPDGSLLLVAVKDIKIENERLEGRVVEPNVAVPFVLPYAAGNDPQMEAALSEAARCCAKNASTSLPGFSR